MEHAVENNRLAKRAYWLVKLRWIATVCVGVFTYFSSNVLGIVLHDLALYGIMVLLALYNFVVWLLLNHFTRDNSEPQIPLIKKIINFQMSADLLILTVLLHFSGGIENPLVFFFVFHMIIASILLSVQESYLQAAFAVLLFGLLILLEYLQFIPHYCLQGFVVHCLHREVTYLLGTYFTFATTLYLVVYMTSYIAVRLRGTEKAYRKANILLREKDRIKDEYVLRVTHDIKSHLATIQSCLEAATGKFVGSLNNKRQADLAGRAYKRTKVVTHFVKTLLRLTQLRLNNKMEAEIFPLRNAVDNAVLAVKPVARDKSVTLNSHIESSVDKILGNPFSIEEMFTNLLLNAIKYTPKNGTVGISAKADSGYIIVEVTDTGIGIPKNEIDMVFDEFFRASNARKAERDGTGLGLSIVKQIVERHGGQVGVISEEGHGTTFRVKLPKAD